MKQTTLPLLLLAAGFHADWAEHRLFRRDDDPADFGWVKKFAAIGDSYTAGIGSGNPLGSAFLTFNGDQAYRCSRYDTSYPMIIQDEMGFEDFQYVACSGDRTGNIYEQIKDLDGDINLLIMTAGGNDLCLSSIITRCVFSPYSEEDCQDVLDIAQDNLDSIMKANFEILLDALDDKMADDSVVVFNGYAQFFNTENEDCAKEEDWTLWNPTGGAKPLTLTIERRQTFNDLVIKLNDIIRGVVDDARQDGGHKYRIGFSNWDYWPSRYVRGQYCDPASSGEYPDEGVPDLQFFKPDTRHFTSIGDDDSVRVADAEESESEAVRARSEEVDEALARSPSFRRTRNPQHLAHQRLARQGPARANCPGDKDEDLQPSGGGWIPDDIGKNFHPNELGHFTIASWALQTAVSLRAEVLGVTAPECERVDEGECYSNNPDLRAYASKSRLNERYQDFCDDVEEHYHGGEKGWEWSGTYDKGTPEETTFKIELAETTDEFDKDECLESMARIVNGCGRDDPSNPMDWKFGGRWRRGDHTYTVTPQRERPWPKDGEDGGGRSCESWYFGSIGTSYSLQGAGWANWDYGQDSLLPAIEDCVGRTITGWNFEYYDEPTEDGYEWRAHFTTPPWSNSHCFDNNKVQLLAGGWTDGCNGSG
ncbi:SGNH/GDSL hydrolase family protein [Aspergillus lucknowensis]|uniref:SGNH hydrolase-type esterase domain-containing protein n=1 Tax=Aspergillus lucknowensis TaxID=176173 RepID=A0ABR4L944_9EURO